MQWKFFSPLASLGGRSGYSSLALFHWGQNCPCKNLLPLYNNVPICASLPKGFMVNILMVCKFSVSGVMMIVLCVVWFKSQKSHGFNQNYPFLGLWLVSWWRSLALIGPWNYFAKVCHLRIKTSWVRWVMSDISACQQFNVQPEFFLEPEFVHSVHLNWNIFKIIL